MEGGKEASSSSQLSPPGIGPSAERNGKFKGAGESEGSYMRPPLSLLCSGPSKPKSLGCSIHPLPSRPFLIFVVLLWVLVAIIWVTQMSEDSMLFALSLLCDYSG